VGVLWGLGRVSAVAYARGAVFGFFVYPAVSASRSWSQALRRLGRRLGPLRSLGIEVCWGRLGLVCGSWWWVVC
jgi:hypothetical protein